ncbi:tetraprenyl-beta-curcumene synthase family protein [Priestia koreensis]|uniref:tetraprenyl-beta-curcumene synthase family protein n=1 Tax=Priestia koreensis TaxID=284581 RepID=UPI00241251D6|nr:tetraprenyl-beta-curcumene synthase family protein [Priestia koreensis]
MKIPSRPLPLMRTVYRQVIPAVHKQLEVWKAKAEAIPNEELRTQALNSITDKTFHCEGGGILAILAKDQLKDCIEFIVAYQTISDYLDNLCDRSTSLDPLDFEALHESMPHALNPEATLNNYYRHREDQDDGGYLHDLVQTCQQVLKRVPNYEAISQHLLELADYYCALQVHKHVKVEERVPRLEKWFQDYKQSLPKMEWYEFSACSGSTLGIFCLVAYGFQNGFSSEEAHKVKKSYFPYVQGLHILLDYFIDQEEDKEGGDLNFCFYYDHQEEMMDRFGHFVSEADRHLRGIRDERFHRLINRGLLGVYLSDDKVRKQEDVYPHAKKLIRQGGSISYFFYWNGRLYRKLSKAK